MLRNAGKMFLFQAIAMGALVLSGPSFVHAAEDATNVTSLVTAAVKDNKLTISADNGVFTDTAPGIPKKLTVEYRIGDEKLKREVNEGGKLEIVVPDGQKLVIIKAVYGPLDGSTPQQNDASIAPMEVLETLPGFKIEHVLKSERTKGVSWINMTKDPKGRLLLGAQRGQAITRVTLENGKVVKDETLSIPVTETMGMLFVDNVLYLNGAGTDGKYCLFRCKDTKGDDSYDDVEGLREWRGGAGERRGLRIHALGAG